MQLKSLSVFFPHTLVIPLSAVMSGLNINSESPEVSVVTWTTTDVTELGPDDDDNQGYNLGERIAVGTVLAIIILTAFGGNLLVCVAILTDPQLKSKKANIFLVSLAMADILVAVMVMTFALINDVLGRWEFGSTFCLIWICFDITGNTASILNLCLICVDRYLQITRPMHYEMWMTKKKIAVLVGSVWLLSILLSFVPLHLGWHRPPPDQRLPLDPYLCILGISFVYAVVSSAVSFYIPCIITVALYLKLFLLAKSHVKVIGQHKVPETNSTEINVFPRVSIKDSFKSSNRKAVATLGAIVGVFLVFWLPFFIIYPIAACCATCITPLTFQVLTWLGYANSCANPFIYSLFNKDFRNAFQRRLLIWSDSVISTSVPPSIIKQSHTLSSGFTVKSYSAASSEVRLSRTLSIGSGAFQQPVPENDVSEQRV